MTSTSQEKPRATAAKSAAAASKKGAPGVLDADIAQLTSKAEISYLKQSGKRLSFAPIEKARIIEVPNFPSLGRLTALRFLEWVLENPEGVCSLPTGKTPEYFIRWTQHFLRNWNSKEVQADLARIGLPGDKKPDLRGLYFVQIDEFYPIDPAQHNSFHYYVSKHYIKGFGLDRKRALLIDPTSIGVPKGMKIDDIFPDGKVDLGLRSRLAQNPQEALQQRVIGDVDQFCSDYEARIRELGGIGFFLGGIGPDGHIGFNARGSHLFSPTRLTYTNYETEAAAAGDLGGIEVSRHKPVITVGLGTITHNPDAVVIIFAAGDAKARVVADAVQCDKGVAYPASVLQGLKNGRFYLTEGATVRLVERAVDYVLKAEKISDELLEKATVDRALVLGRRLDQLTAKDVGDDRILAHVLERTGKKLPEAAAWVRARLIDKIDRGRAELENQTILHTGPHHDDISLGYMPYIMHLVRRPTNRNYFNVLTSGFTAVTNSFLAEILRDVADLLGKGDFDKDSSLGSIGLDDPSARSAEIFMFLDGIAGRDDAMKRRAQAHRMLHNLTIVYEDEDLENIRERVAELHNYLETLYPGKKDMPHVQRLKGMQREYEEELVWGYVGAEPNDVFHLRLGFYTGDIFTEQPTMDRDVAPFLELLHKLEPSIVTVTFDPEGSGPDTHYKVLQVISEGLRRYKEKTGHAPMVWGYRNVWYRFHPSEGTLFVPATLNTMAVMDNSFMECFGSQKNASFPSFDYDGPFCHLAQRLWVEQFNMLRTCLGERYFLEHKSPRMRAARGFVFIREMPLDEFVGGARRLAEATEGV